MLFTARERFDSSCGESWAKYLEFLGRDDLVRVITLDTILCPPVVYAATQEDWDALEPDSNSMSFFVDLPLVRRKAAAGSTPCDILAAIREPQAGDQHDPGPEFEFAGFDLVDRADEVSALLNCGGFPETFSIDELSSSTGLLQSLARAYEVREDLLRHNPHEDHADCCVWAMWAQRR